MRIFGMDGGSTLFLLLLFALLAIIPARIAKSKGYSFGGFYAFGFFLFPLAIVTALVMRGKSDQTISSADEIAKYKKLMDEGVITAEEFETKKAALMK